LSLKKGYTTGVHASIAFRFALEAYLKTQERVFSVSKKIPNDDMDATIGARVFVKIASSVSFLDLNPIPHKPYRYKNLSLYSANGVGVVTKDGLKAPKGYPAINPKPLSVIYEIYDKFAKNRDIFASIGVIDGEEIAKKTANAKVGVLGGISILGTTGWVKPVSSSAYIDSIEVEMSVAKAQGYSDIALTIGSSSKEKALKEYNEIAVIEIGNFVKESLTIASKIGFERVRLYCGLGKAVKIAQGFENTHNRFGSIDFEKLRRDYLNYAKVTLDIDEVKTVKGVYDRLDSKEQIRFREFVKDRATQYLKRWYKIGVVECILV